MEFKNKSPFYEKSVIYYINLNFWNDIPKQSPK